MPLLSNHAGARPPPVHCALHPLLLPQRLLRGRHGQQVAPPLLPTPCFPAACSPLTFFRRLLVTITTAALWAVSDARRAAAHDGSMLLLSETTRAGTTGIVVGDTV
jgi:hypothetical protein